MDNYMKLNVSVNDRGQAVITQEVTLVVARGCFA